jgi:hypothetical protein
MKRVKTKTLQECFICRYCRHKVTRISDTNEPFIEETDSYDAENFCDEMCETYHYVGRP